MIYHYRVIYPHGAVRSLTVTWPDVPRYEQLRALVSGLVGGHMEHVYLYRGRNARALDMFVNEEGKLLGLPVNPRATRLLQEANGGQGFIVGTAVVFEEQVWY